MRKISEAWNDFFFKPISPATIGVFRIAFGLVVFIAILGKLPFRSMFYSDAGFVSYATMSHLIPNPPWLYFRWVPETDPALLVYFLGILAAAVSLTLGFFTRTSSILVFFGLISLSNRDLFVDNTGDDLMRINALILIFAEAGAAFSVDRWLRKKRGLEGGTLPLKSPWAQRLLQLQLAYLYINTFYLKLPGESWHDGTALYYARHYAELERFKFKCLFYYLWQIKLFSWGALLVEFAAGTLIWFKKLRYPCLIGAFLLHFGINLTMQFPVFQYVMMASLINFIYPEDIERWLLKLKRSGSPHIV